MKIRWLVFIVVITGVISCRDTPPAVAVQVPPVSADTGPVEQRLYKRYRAAIQESNDSLKKELLLDISYDALSAKDSVFFIQTNTEARELSSSLKDSVGIAITYWDLAQYYRKLNNRDDSAYYYYNKAQKIYEALDDQLNSGKLLVNMAITQKDIKDYTGSEVTTINAITLLSSTDDYYSLYVAYNNLGIVYNELEEYEKSLEYHQKALDNFKKTGSTKRIPFTYNNMGVVYSNKKEYGRAVPYFKKALENAEDLQQTDPETYAMRLDNLAYAKFHLEDSAGAYHQLIKALEIRKQLNPPVGISVSHLHLADYFLYKKDTTQAVQHALAAEEDAARNGNTRDVLLALKFLSANTEDRALDYSRHYIQINDSLYKQERAVRNKLARIRFETDEYISEAELLNQKIARQTVVFSSIFIILVLLAVIIYQRSRHKIVKQEQQANREVYNLVLSQQQEIESGQQREKERISRELHDGILGRLFGVRLNLDALNEKSDVASKQKRTVYIKEIQHITEEIRVISHELNRDAGLKTDFKTLLEELIRKQPEGVKIRLQADTSVDWTKADDNLKINIYRIIQEAVMNIYRHAEATQAWVEITRTGNKLKLCIKDNGKGFETDKPAGGIGFKNMRNRARAIRGKFSVKSGAEGTSVIIRHINL